MWGNIALETITQVNFGIGFSNMKSDVLIHLSQWQYWWWFWFTFLWSFYYLLVLRVVRFRSLKFRPRIATTFRPHGKWGDIIVCIIPISWCANILSNSNAILRMIEWQAESGLFTIRIRGKQWYWIYKFELKAITDIITAPKNIGRNKWRITTPSDMQSSDDYLHILQLRAQNKWVQKYWNKELTKNNRLNKFRIVSPEEQLSSFFRKRMKNLTLIALSNKKSFCVKIPSYTTVYKENTPRDFINHVNFKKNSWSIFKKNIIGETPNLKIDDITYDSKKNLKNAHRWAVLFLKNIKFKSVNHIDFFETTRFLKRSTGSRQAIRFIKLPISSKNDWSIKDSLLRLRFNDDESFVKNKPTPHSTFLTMKQKRYKRRKIILPRYRYLRDDEGKLTKKTKYTGKPFLFNNNFIVENDLNATKQYNMLKKKKKRSEMTSVVLSRRMLRTKRTLVLPAHVNITAITNSYDVIHSWFIPGLGLKMDCIPGRSTHHTFYIDNVGFYYGQCAEVCGRFHHHMPIRICALPFEHFLLWWHTFGLPKLLFTTNKKNQQLYYGFRKFTW